MSKGAPVERAVAEFQAIAERLAAEVEGVASGRMMSSPGMRYGEKYFAFFQQGSVVFRLGRGYDLAAHGVTDYHLLAPYKTRPPLADWFVVPPAHLDAWDALARAALARLREAPRGGRGR
jgi:hypothetical protein